MKGRGKVTELRYKSRSQQLTCLFFFLHSDYRKSLTESPFIPFDASKTPTHGLLKSGSTTSRRASSAVRSSQSRKHSVRKRPSASDFF